MPSTGKVDIFAVHSRFNLPELQTVLHSDSLFVTVVREPVSLYESLYFFFRLNLDYGLTLEEFAAQPLEVPLTELLHQCYCFIDRENRRNYEADNDNII